MRQRVGWLLLAVTLVAGACGGSAGVSAEGSYGSPWDMVDSLNDAGFSCLADPDDPEAHFSEPDAGYLEWWVPLEAVICDFDATGVVPSTPEQIVAYVYRSEHDRVVSTFFNVVLGCVTGNAAESVAYAYGSKWEVQSGDGDSGLPVMEAIAQPLGGNAVLADCASVVTYSDSIIDEIDDESIYTDDPQPVVVSAQLLEGMRQALGEVSITSDAGSGSSTTVTTIVAVSGEYEAAEQIAAAMEQAGLGCDSLSPLYGEDADPEIVPASGHLCARGFESLALIVYGSEEDRLNDLFSSGMFVCGVAEPTPEAFQYVHGERWAVVSDDPSGDLYAEIITAGIGGAAVSVPCSVFFAVPNVGIYREDIPPDQKRLMMGEAGVDDPAVDPQRLCVINATLNSAGSEEDYVQARELVPEMVSIAPAALRPSVTTWTESLLAALALMEDAGFDESQIDQEAFREIAEDTDFNIARLVIFSWVERYCG